MLDRILKASQIKWKYEYLNNIRSNTRKYAKVNTMTLHWNRHKPSNQTGGQTKNINKLNTKKKKIYSVFKNGFVHFCSVMDDVKKKFRSMAVRAVVKTVQNLGNRLKRVYFHWIYWVVLDGQHTRTQMLTWEATQRFTACHAPHT